MPSLLTKLCNFFTCNDDNAIQENHQPLFNNQQSSTQRYEAFFNDEEKTFSELKDSALKSNGLKAAIEILQYSSLKYDITSDEIVDILHCHQSIIDNKTIDRYLKNSQLSIHGLAMANSN